MPVVNIHQLIADIDRSTASTIQSIIGAQNKREEEVQNRYAAYSI